MSPPEVDAIPSESEKIDVVSEIDNDWTRVRGRPFNNNKEAKEKRWLSSVPTGEQGIMKKGPTDKKSAKFERNVQKGKTMVERKREEIEPNTCAPLGHI